uniref:TNFR-Cys domain-containing protein n=1 Tax=Scleropages formosus TaxID=113540 RepID=A0A8C9UWU8_SCLFO
LFSFQICVVFLLIVENNPCSACGWAQYEIDGTCCTMCTPGYFVYTHCTRTDITVCVQCPNSTFTDKPHGRRICNPCTACNDDSGLKTVKECKPSSDAVCGVLEGNYCIDPYEGGCRAAKKHTTCKPGHFIKHPGTHSNDTVCENCPGNSFSDGTSTFCIPHTNCKAKRLSTVKAGDSVSDAECGERSRIPLIVVIIALVSVLVVIVGEVLKFKYKKIKIEPPLNGEYFCNLIKIIGDYCNSAVRTGLLKSHFCALLITTCPNQDHRSLEPILEALDVRLTGLHPEWDYSIY